MKALTFILLLACSAFAQTTQPTASKTQPATQPALPAQVVVSLPPTPDMRPMLQAAIDKAVKGGATLTIAPGDYWIKSHLIVSSAKRLTIEGTGAKLRALPTMPRDATGDLLSIIGSDSITVHGLGFDGNHKARGFAEAPISIRLNWSSHVTISGCSFQDDVCDGVFMWGGLGSTMGPCRYIEIVNCNFDSPGRNCVSVVNAQFVHIHDCHMANTGASQPAAGVDVEPNSPDPIGETHDVVIDHNTATNCFQAFTAKQTGKPTRISYLNNTISDGTYGINNEAAGALIQGNALTNMKSYAIGSDNGATATIQNNTIVNCRWTIYVEAGNTVGTNVVKP